MKILRYPLRSLIGDYLRTSGGLGLGLVALAAGPANTVVLVLFAGIVVLFGLFGLKTLQRHLTRVALSHQGVACKDLRTRTIFWPELNELKLRFYGTKRRSPGDRSSFLQLTLAGAGTSFTLESSLEDFNLVAWRAAKAARENSLSIDPTSAGNLLGIGVDADSDDPPPGGLGDLDETKHEGRGASFG